MTVSPSRDLLIEMISAQHALTRIEVEFPSLSDEIKEADGILHLQIAAWSRLTQMAIDKENRELFKRICAVFYELFPTADTDLKNALNVSYLEHLEFKVGAQRRSWAYNAMPDLMRKAWDAMEEYNVKIHGG